MRYSFILLTTVLLACSTAVSSGFTIYFIDVGQGDATLIVDNSGASLLVDGGRSREGIRESLEALGITELDAIAVTHPDFDHIGGLIEVLEMFEVERIYLNGDESDTDAFGELKAGIDSEGAKVATVAREGTISLGGLSVSVLHPGTLTADENRNSLVLLVSCGEVNVLLMGDADATSEKEMLAAGALSDVEVLRVGHHGSKTGTSQEFLDAVNPEVAVISAGRANAFDHPDVEVVDRLKAAEVKILATDTTEADDTLVMESDCQDYNFRRILSPSGLQPPRAGLTALRGPQARQQLRYETEYQIIRYQQKGQLSQKIASP